MTVKVTQREALALRALGGSPAKGLRRLIDQSVSTPRRREAPGEGAVAVTPAPEGPCRIHRTWSRATETLDRGHKTVSKTCLDCGYVSTSTRPA